MKNKIFAAALAALTLGAIALPASAQDFRGGYGGHNNDFRSDWRMRQEIVVRQNGRIMVFDRGDRMFYRLMDRPFNFVPGMSYAYTDQCNRWGCRVIVFSQFSRRPVDSMFAPRIFDRGWRDDGRRYDDRRYDDHDGRFNDDRGYNDDNRLFGAPR